jgi:hypothetical protein
VVKPSRVEFPIFMDPDPFEKHHRIEGFPAEYRRAIEEVQPYDGQRPGLVALHELARVHRHRLIHPIAVFPMEDHYRVLVDNEEFDAAEVEPIPRERLRDGDVVMRFGFPGVDPRAHVEPQVALTVGIDHALARGAVGTSVLNQITPEVAATLSMLEQGFFKSAEASSASRS